MALAEPSIEFSRIPHPAPVRSPHPRIAAALLSIALAACGSKAPGGETVGGGGTGGTGVGGATLTLTGGAVKTARKGVGHFDLKVTGVSAHSGIDPGSGASAVHALAHIITSLEQLNDPVHGVSVNVGVIRGGTRSNVVAETAEAEIDVRVVRAADAAGLPILSTGLIAATILVTGLLGTRITRIIRRVITGEVAYNLNSQRTLPWKNIIRKTKATKK